MAPARMLASLRVQATLDIPMHAITALAVREEAIHGASGNALNSCSIEMVTMQGGTCMLHHRT